MLVKSVILIAIAFFLFPLRDWLRRRCLPFRMVGGLVTVAAWAAGLWGALLLLLWLWGVVGPSLLQ